MGDYRMIQIHRVALALGLVAVATGCYSHTYTVGAGAPAGPLVYDEWQNKWVGGLIGEKNLDVEFLCPSGNATIHDEQSFLNGLVGALTMGIYTPTKVRIMCDTGRSAEVALSPKQVQEIVTSRAFLQRVERVMPGSLEDAQLGVQTFEEDFQD